VTDASDAQLDKTIQSHMTKLRKPGVLTVRPGYEIAGHQLTGKRAVVATVRVKTPLADLDSSEALPDQVGGVPVDVRQASPYQRLRASDPLAAEVSRAYGRPEDEEPSWPHEREVETGKLLTDSQSRAQSTLKVQRGQQKASSEALSSQAKKPNLPYDPKGCPPLNPVTVSARVTAAVSPDCGFATLTGFLAATKQALKIGMYDFTSAPILTAFEKDLVSSKTLQMVLDSPAPNPTQDQSDWMTVQDLNTTMSSRASIARALTRSDHFAAVWSFPSAYHIKVIVRDGDSFWLSSGNLNNSNEPAPDHPKTAEDRDWHVIIENEALTGVFATYLDFDYTTAHAHQASVSAEIERAIEEAHQKKQLNTDPAGTRVHSAKRPPKKPAPPAAKAVQAKTFDSLNLTVTPLLTPDKLVDGTGQYLSHILDLIGQAKKSIYIQLQYIESSSGEGDVYDDLLKAIAKRIAGGIDVRLIVSANYAEKWAEKMKDGKSVDLTANIRTQPDVHNKGFVVDSDIVIVSSQNFSPAGVSQNRDAGAILQSSELASYYEPVFLADWARALPMVAGRGGAATAKGSGGKKAAAANSRSGRSAASKKKGAKKTAKKTTAKKTVKKTVPKSTAKGRKISKKKPSKKKS
jgi:hypothetical protein